MFYNIKSQRISVVFFFLDFLRFGFMVFSNLTFIVDGYPLNTAVYPMPEDSTIAKCEPDLPFWYQQQKPYCVILLYKTKTYSVNKNARTFII